MKFWTTLRWAGALVFVFMVLAIWLGADRSGTGGGGSDQQGRPAPLIIR